MAGRISLPQEPELEMDLSHVQPVTSPPQVSVPGMFQEQSDQLVLEQRQFLQRNDMVSQEGVSLGSEDKERFLGRLFSEVEHLVSPPAVQMMIKEFEKKCSLERWGSPRPENFQELWQALKESGKLNTLFWLQGLLHSAGCVNACSRVAVMARDERDRGGLRLPFFTIEGESPFIDLHGGLNQPRLGQVQVYLLVDFPEVDLTLRHLRSNLAAWLHTEEQDICFPEIMLAHSIWVTVLLPLSVCEALLKAVDHLDVQGYLHHIGVRKIKFTKPAKETASMGPPRKKAKSESSGGAALFPPRRSISVGGRQIPEWISWTKADLIRHFKEKGLPGVAEILSKVDCTGRDMGLWNASSLEDMGMSDEQVRAVKKEMAALDVYGQTKVKVINDPIHGHMEIHPLCIKIIDTPEFQRLRNINQLGSVCLIYPGASHRRFEHSIGVCHLAGQLVGALQERQPSLDITDVDKLCVTIAGLCHDLGHGPYSHHFEQFMREAKPGSNWMHEDCSIMMFDHMVTKNNLESEFLKYGLGEIDLIFIREQIQGVRGDKEAYRGRGEDKRFLYEIVANKRNGIDVDKWDYLSRDSLLLGLRNNFDHHRFIRHARVIRMRDGWRICSRDKEAEDLYKMFQMRYVLSRIAYQHKVHQAIEAMMVDALLCADKSDAITYLGRDGKRLHISECVTDPEAFTSLDDSVFSRIQFSEAPELTPAREILNDVRCRRLYRLVGETEPSAKKMDHKVLQELVTAPLRKDRYVVKEMILDYGMKEKNPIEEMLFYRKDDPNSAVKISKAQVSLFLPEKFLEQIVRLYSKDRDKHSFDMAARQFERWCDRHALHVRAGWHS